MTDEEWYNHFQEMAQKMFEDFKLYLELLNGDGKKNYLRGGIVEGNTFLFNIGNNRLMVRYTINLKTLELQFKTFLIEPSKYYGSFNLKELEDFDFNVDSYKSVTFATTKEHVDPVYKRTYEDRRIHSFPATYLNVLKKVFIESL